MPTLPEFQPGPNDHHAEMTADGLRILPGLGDDEPTFAMRKAAESNAQAELARIAELEQIEAEQKALQEDLQTREATVAAREAALAAREAELNAKKGK